MKPDDEIKPRNKEKQTELGKPLEAELLYHTLFNQSPDGILIIDANGKFVEFNAAAHRQLGYSREEFKKLQLSDIDPFQSLEDIQASIKNVLEHGSDEFEVRHKTKEGDLRDVHVITQLMSMSGRSLFHTIWRDVTEHKRTDRALMGSNANLLALVNSIPDLVLFKDVHGKYIAVNKATEKSTGLTSEQLVGKTNDEILPPDVASLCNASDEAALKSVRPVHSEEYTGKDGEKIILDTIKAPIHDARGNLIGLVAVSRDITERKQMEEALRTSERFIRDILETVDEGFIVIDRDFRIISVNKAYLNQVRMEREAVMGRHCYEISHRNNRPCYEMGEQCAVKHAFDTGDPFTALHVHHDSDKNPVYVETKSYPLKDALGNTVSAIEIINNTTEKKKLEEQLRHAQKMEAVGQLAGGIAHDFNNILTAITGYGSLMMRKMGEDDPSKNFLQQILDSSQRAANLTRGLLAFSRKQEISPAPALVNKIIENVEKLLRRLIGEDVELKVFLADGDLTVMADSGQIEQVLVNLATNARDAMSDGGWLTIRTETVALDREFIKAHGYGNPGTFACVSVTDSGAGMDDKTKERIFEPFYTTKEVGKGTGLGLAIVYGIVKQHNGYITCYSAPGKGTTFKIYLPLIGRNTPRAAADVHLPESGGTETVLVAEDDAPVRALVKEVLGQFGYTVLEAVDGEDAIAVFMKNRDRVQLLILDVIMPKKNGKEVFEEIRKERPDVKVVFSSGYTADILHKKGIPDEEFNFISKPVSPAELLRKVRAALDKGVEKTKV
jgi:two-component system cell cycle sensor histidine kinase/response regulator CckA